MENRFISKETVESQSDTKSSSKSQDSSSYYDCMKNGVGIAAAGAWKVAEAALKVTTAGLAIQAGLGMRGVDGFSAPSSGTELQVRGDYNLSKVPESIIQQERLAQIEKQAQTLRAVAEKANKNPEFARKLLETWKGKRQNKETERLTPDKIDPVVWESVGRMLTEKAPRRELNDNTGTAVILVHGITGIELNGSGAGSNCNDNYWGDAINYLTAQGYSDIRTVQYYTGDTNCDVDLHNSAYQYRCDGFNPGSEGTNNEDLDHVSCLLVQYLNQNFAGQNVILVGHSMGGIVIRNAMYLVQENGGQLGFPSDIGYVTDAVTFNTPHAGVNDLGLIGCALCTQINQLGADNPFMTELIQNAQNPQTSAGFTQWTVVGSECDPIVGSSLNPDGAANAVAMDASHAIMFSQDNSATCYDHGGALHDSSMANDATLYSCDTNPNVPCGTDYQNQAATVTNWVKTTTGSHGFQTLYEAVQQ
jgi:hypothetical protein